MTTPLQRRPTGARLPFGEWFNDIINRVNAIVAGTVTGVFTGTFNGVLGGTTPATATVTDLHRSGYLFESAQLIAAAGATQGAATLMTKSAVIIVTSTASARGVRLPSAVTNLVVRLLSLCTQGTKVYPFAGDRIGSAATNIAVVIAGFKGNLYQAKNTSQWAVLKGA